MTARPAANTVEQETATPVSAEAPPDPRIVILTDEEYRSENDCAMQIQASGFPAISSDGSTIVLDQFEVGDLSTGDMDGSDRSSSSTHQRGHVVTAAC